MLQAGSDRTCSCSCSCSCSVFLIACQICAKRYGTLHYGTCCAGAMHLTMYEHTARQQASKLSNKNIFCVSHFTRNKVIASHIEPGHILSFSFLLCHFHFLLFHFIDSDHYITYTLQCNVRCRAVHLQRCNASLINHYCTAILFFPPLLFSK